MSELALSRDPEALVVQARTWLAELRADPDGIREARRIGVKLDALHSAARRVGESQEMEMAYAEATRHADRRLGQLLTAGRDAGTIASKGRAASPKVSAETLSDLDIHHQLSADAAAFAKPEDDEWEDILAEARQEANLSRASVRRLSAAIAAMSDEELALRRRLIDGETIIVSYRGDRHQHLIAYADFHDLLERIDRQSDWGNPFEMPDDGDRDEVIDKFERHYLPHKPGLLDRVPSLRGKALACWCAPLACHGDILKRRAES